MSPTQVAPLSALLLACVAGYCAPALAQAPPEETTPSDPPPDSTDAPPAPPDEAGSPDVSTGSDAPAQPTPADERPDQEAQEPIPPAEPETAASEQAVPSYEATAQVRQTGASEIPRYSTGMRMDVPLREIPNTVQVVEESEIEQRGAGDVNSALYYVPGVNPTWRYGGFQQVRSRGFRALLLNDGVRDNRSAYVNSAPQSGLWSLDRIEVLKGPNAALYGFGSIGGVVNLVHKQPHMEPGSPVISHSTSASPTPGTTTGTSAPNTWSTCPPRTHSKDRR